MSSKLKMLAIAAAMAAGTSSVAMAQVCPAGTAWNGATCATAPGYVYAPSNPVSGAAAGGAAGAATGAATAGPVGAVVGGAVGTAAAIATSPIGGEEYARRNGFVCVPGTWFRGEDGRRHLCQ